MSCSQVSNLKCKTPVRTCTGSERVLLLLSSRPHQRHPKLWTVLPELSLPWTVLWPLLYSSNLPLPFPQRLDKHGRPSLHECVHHRTSLWRILVLNAAVWRFPHQSTREFLSCETHLNSRTDRTCPLLPKWAKWKIKEETPNLRNPAVVIRVTYIRDIIWAESQNFYRSFITLGSRSRTNNRPYSHAVLTGWYPEISPKRGNAYPPGRACSGGA